MTWPFVRRIPGRRSRPGSHRWALAACLLWASSCGRIVVLHDALTPAEHQDLGVAYERAGRLDLAEREYRRALRDGATSVTARVNLGNVAAARERWAEAERWYRSALRRTPDDADALNNLAYVLMRRSRRLEEAEALAAHAVALGGRDSLYRATLEEIRRARSRPDRPETP